MPAFTSPTGYTMEPWGIIRIEDNALIPFEPGNTDYERYLKWLDGYESTGHGWELTKPGGNTPEPADTSN